MKLQKPKGTQDILPAESAKWQYVEGFAREIFKRYNYAEVRTPISSTTKSSVVLLETQRIS